MKLFHLTLAVTSSIAMTMAHSAGLERSKQSIAPLFEEGNYAEASYAYVKPNIKAKDGFDTKADGMIEDYGFAGAAVKVAPTDRTGLALFYNKPWGVDTTYPESSTMFNSPLGTTQAHVDSDALGVVASTKVGNNFTFYTGMEYQTSEGHVKAATPVGLKKAIDEVAKGPFTKEQIMTALAKAKAKDPTITPQDMGVAQMVQNIAKAPTLYELEMEKNDTFVPMVGFAYEKPEIALRTAVTYRAPAEYKMETSERFSTAVGGLPIQKSTTDVKFPQSVSVDFQTGLSEKHKLLGMVNARWVDWSEFKVAPSAFSAVKGEPLASYEKDQYSIEVAVGKKFTPKFAAEVRGSYDSGTGSDLSLLGPYGAVKGIALGAKYDVTDKMSVSGGAKYMMVDGGKVPHPDDPKKSVLTVEDSNAYALGMKVAYKF